MKRLLVVDTNPNKLAVKEHTFTICLRSCQPRDILCGAADEVLVVLKNERRKDKDKKLEVEELLGSLAEERFALLINLGKKISDWKADDKMQTGACRLKERFNKTCVLRSMNPSIECNRWILHMIQIIALPKWCPKAGFHQKRKISQK